MELGALSWLHDPEHVGPREEGVPRLHLQPRWPRHDPLLLRQRGHLAECHQPTKEEKVLRMDGDEGGTTM